MNTATAQNTVVAMRCENYDREAIGRIIEDGMAILGFRPRGRVFVKPNVVFAYNTDVFGDMAFTATPFVGAALGTLAGQSGVQRVDMGENSAIGFPTRLCYQNAGYYEEVARVRQAATRPVDLFCMDEVPRQSVFVGGQVHDNLRISRKMAMADTKVYLPKLKGHCVSNMTGAVKLNIGICSDDERAIRHDFLLNEKIVDLLAVGYPDFIVMDAIDVGVGNEAFPVRRKLGLVLMGTNPLAVDLVGARLLGLGIDDVPYLKAAANRGYAPADVHDVTIAGDLSSLEEIDRQAERLQPYDDDFYGWQDVEKELRRRDSPMRFFWGPYRGGNGEKCLTGCVMGLKMFLGGVEKHAGAGAFAQAKPAVFVIGNVAETIDARGGEAYKLGSCAAADIVNAKKIIHIDKCFTTASDMNLAFAHRLGMPAITRDMGFLKNYVGAIAASSLRKLVGLRYFQDAAHFAANGLVRKV